MSDLKPCPFCGSPAIHNEDHTTERCDSVYCSKCNLMLSDFNLDGEQGECINVWNTRTTPTMQEAAKVVIEAWKNSNPPYYVIDIPLTATGDGPATVGCDADTITYEVWNAATLSTVSKFDKLSDANRACMERNLRALSEEPQ